MATTSPCLTGQPSVEPTAYGVVEAGADSLVEVLSVICGIWIPKIHRGLVTCPLLTVPTERVGRNRHYRTSRPRGQIGASRRLDVTYAPRVHSNHN